MVRKMSKQNTKQATSLSERFNDEYEATPVGDYVLQVSNGCYDCYYDFMARMMFTEGTAATPFSQLDRETLVEFRKKLIDLGGTPPKLPAETPATASRRKARPQRLPSTIQG
jgi:hypothetical protein